MQYVRLRILGLLGDYLKGSGIFCGVFGGLRLDFEHLPGIGGVIRGFAFAAHSPLLAGSSGCELHSSAAETAVEFILGEVVCSYYLSRRLIVAIEDSV